MPVKGMNRVKAAIKNVGEDTNGKLTALYFQTLTNIVKQTPVDSGRARNGWFLTVGTPWSGGDRSADKNGTGSLSSLTKMPNDVLGKRIFFTNPTPYINALEFGGYPKNVEYGSWVPETKSYQILSTNGWSNQILHPPSGMARFNIQKLQKQLDKL